MRTRKIPLAGISNASIEQIDIARRVLGEGNLASVQNQFSPAFRSSEAERMHCAQLGIAFLPGARSAASAARASSAPGTLPSRKWPTRVRNRDRRGLRSLTRGAP